MALCALMPNYSLRLSNIKIKAMVKKKLFMLLAATGTMFVSCVDNNYKLSDLDTTVGVSVNNLTIPLNVDSLVLDQVLDLDDDGKVKKYTLENGEEIVYDRSRKLYWDDYDYVEENTDYGPGKWYHSKGPYNEYLRRYECVPQCFI